MAYRLKEIILPEFLPYLNDNTVSAFSKSYYNHVKCKSSDSSKVIIYEICKIGLYTGLLCGRTEKTVTHDYCDIDNFATVTDTYSSALYYNTKYRYTTSGETVNIDGFTCTNPRSSTSVWHVVFSQNVINVYSPVDKTLLSTIKIPEGFFNNGFVCLGAVFNTVGVTITPDVESFTYPPFVSHDMDLYSAILNLPYTPVYFDSTTRKNNNILSIL